MRSLIAVLLVPLLTVQIIGMISVDDSPAAESRTLGIPNISREYSPLVKYSIDQIVTTEEYVYILYGEHDGNVQVFDRNGIYQYSAYFFAHINGVFRIAAKGDLLYVCDNQYNVYVMQNGELKEFIHNYCAVELLETIDFYASSTEYVVRMGSVWRIADKMETCIIERPFPAVLYQNSFMFFANLLLVLLVGAMSMTVKRIGGQGSGSPVTMRKKTKGDFA